jgi:hypothetical protein
LSTQFYQPNPLSVANLRIVSRCPLHFFAVDFDMSCSAKKVTDWIYSNLQGRFYFGQVTSSNSNNGVTNLILCSRAAFEIHSEASYFALSLPEINKF